MADESKDVVAWSKPYDQPAGPPAPTTQLLAIIHELSAAIQLRAWEVVEGVAHKLHQYQLAGELEAAPAGEEPSERAQQHRPMTDEEWENRDQAKQEPSVEPVPALPPLQPAYGGSVTPGWKA